MPYLSNHARLLYSSPLGFLKLLRDNRPLDWKRLASISVFFLNACRIYPMGLLERQLRGNAIQRTRPGEPPLFILGHFRSGTTFLHKLLARDTQWAILNGWDLLFPYAPPSVVARLKPFVRWAIKRLGIQNTHFHNYDFDPDDPVEEDLFLLSTSSSVSAYWGFVFPVNARELMFRYVAFRDETARGIWRQVYSYLLSRMAFRNPGKRLLLKNPPSTARVKALLELYPDAKFVYLARNPLHVFASSLNLIRETVKPLYVVQNLSEEAYQAALFEHYRMLIDSYESEKEAIPPENLLEWRYEDLMEDPLNMLRALYQRFGLGDFEEKLPFFQGQLEKEKGYSPRKHNLDDRLVSRIEGEWGRYFDQWGYEKKTTNG